MSFLRRRQKTAAVLGCGPAGLFALHALHEKGWDVKAFSKKRRSEMFGAQYLHKPIPGLSTTSAHLIYLLQGSAADYAQKVYDGAVTFDSVSPSSYAGMHPVWDIREAYYKAWEIYAAKVIHMPIDSSSIDPLIRTFDLVVSSIPAPQICSAPKGEHLFLSQKVWAIGDAPERGTFCPIEVSPMSVVCNGKETPGWYRASNVFGYKTAEWPYSAKPPITDVAEVEKPIRTTCDCWINSSRFLRVGRFGTWTKGVLSHEAYETVRSKA